MFNFVLYFLNFDAVRGLLLRALIKGESVNERKLGFFRESWYKNSRSLEKPVVLGHGEFSKSLLQKYEFDPRTFIFYHHHRFAEVLIIQVQEPN